MLTSDVLFVPLGYLGYRPLQTDILPLGLKFEKTSGAPLLGRSGEEKLHIGIGKDNCPDVAPFQHDPPVFTQLPLHAGENIPDDFP